MKFTELDGPPLPPLRILHCYTTSVVIGVSVDRYDCGKLQKLIQRLKSRVLYSRWCTAINQDADHILRKGKGGY